VKLRCVVVKREGPREGSFVATSVYESMLRIEGGGVQCFPPCFRMRSCAWCLGRLTHHAVALLFQPVQAMRALFVLFASLVAVQVGLRAASQRPGAPG
jgi:hypothetical protein